jgi:hypothetical protein
LTCRAPQHLDFSQAKTTVSESKRNILFSLAVRPNPSPNFQLITNLKSSVISGPSNESST